MNPLQIAMEMKRAGVNPDILEYVNFYRAGYVEKNVIGEDIVNGGC